VCSEGDQTRKRVCVEVEEGEEDLMRQYAAAELPDAPPTNPRGVLAGVEVSVSPLFLVEDQGIAAEVVRSHGGNLYLVYCDHFMTTYLLSPSSLLPLSLLSPPSLLLLSSLSPPSLLPPSSLSPTSLLSPFFLPASSGTVVSAPRGSYLLVPLEEAGETSWRDRGARPVTMIWLVGCTI